MTPRHLGLLAVVLALVTAPVLAGCGGEEESSTERWAGGVCSELSTWAEDVEEAVRSVTDPGLALDAERVQSVVDGIRESTDELVEGLGDLERPDSDAGEQARSRLDELARQLREQLAEVEGAAASGALGLASVGAAIAAATAAVASTFESLQSLDDELRGAFDDAGDCESFRERIETTG